MRRVVACLSEVLFLFGTQAFASQTILLRMRPLALEEGVTEIYEAHGVVIDGRRSPHALQLQFKNVVREASRQTGHAEKPVGVLALAAEMGEEEWKALLSRVEAKVETLDSESFRANWVGFEAHLGGDDAWGALLDPETEYAVTVCFTPANGSGTAVRFMSAHSEEPTGGPSIRTMKSTYPAERSQGFCGPLDGAFAEAPLKVLHTMPATLEERVERLVVAELDETQARETAKLPPGASWMKGETNP